ncbi:hypothetical protein PhCBS80983_g00900 [Powellomyces hirtus]|uniref:LPPG:FO 2-phospho-L-lactate transferase CofD/UPF0052 n=1 Tax=Powellomyces hirtus TaxID=109895 RepID=A0A507EC02_9FUNG|nr:hypothetical protein PhCBS80983_g00900 [Powellomyces hirtus]
MSAPAPISIPMSARYRLRDDIPISATSSPRSIAVFSGGSAMNTFVTLLQSATDDTAYIMPVSDDGGSTSEIIKVLGGPGIGDLRSRVVRLAETSSFESKAVHDLLSYRLPFDDPTSKRPSAKAEWLEMLEGRHVLWQGISHPYRETIRTFLAHFQHELFKSATRGPPFDFQGGSIGNFFLTGSRLFFDNLDAAVFQFARIMRVPPRTEVVPVLATTRGSVTIAAAQRDGNVIVGQCEISHPGQVAPEGARPRTGSLGKDKDIPSIFSPDDLHPDQPPAQPFYSLTRNISQNLIFNKATCPPLASPIRRIYYVNREQQEIFPDVNPLVAAQLARKRTVIFGCGSLYTSILPCLIVPGVGRLLADKIPVAPPAPFPIRGGPPLSRVKLLLLNGSHDRETEGYTALDFIYAITDALNYSCMVDERRAQQSSRRESFTRSIVNDMEGFSINPADRDSDGRPAGLGWWLGDEPLTSSSPPTYSSSPCPIRVNHTRHSVSSSSGLTPPPAPHHHLSPTHLPGINSPTLVEVCPSRRTYLASPHPPQAYMTHLLYPEDGAVKVDVEQIEQLGIRCVRVRAAQVGSGTEKGLYGIDELRDVLDHLIM